MQSGTHAPRGQKAEQTEASWEGAGDHSLVAFERNYAKVNLADIRQRVAVRMRARGEYFTSAYRHEETELHRIVRGIIGSTVILNGLINCQSVPAAASPAIPAPLENEAVRKAEPQG